MFGLALSIGLLGGVATWLAFGPLAGLVTIWAIFIGWAQYFHNGADTAALKNTIVCSIFGAVLAGVAFILMGLIPLGDLLTAPVWVAVKYLFWSWAHQFLLFLLFHQQFMGMRLQRLMQFISVVALQQWI